MRRNMSGIWAVQTLMVRQCISRRACSTPYRSDGKPMVIILVEDMNELTFTNIHR